ncbi:caspase family protein [Nocardioides aurantiacus]|uniref:Caspase domain-containing protein n=1 Tax=Nocardioides aurantiacus TaxID=86796 RepID=A0A3N2CTS0_9ACTN|nr:caspase family protein [Nocardioides aurantiacus]ROR90932.1 caspase domain-containing protein [Nocardioides aurantiacus]
MKRALLVGIDSYDQIEDLEGCVNDVQALSPLFHRDDDAAPNFETVTLTAGADGGYVSRDDLVKAVGHLLSSPADQAVLYFAGHGEEADEDVTLMTSDATEYTPGLRFTEILSRIEGSPVQQIVVILDCCFSGGAGRVPMIARGAAIRQGLSMLTSSRVSETSAETAEGRGQFSTYLEGALEGGAAEITGEVTVAGAYAYLSEAFGAWEQRPTFKANLDSLKPLRRCTPPVSPSTLRELSNWFPDPFDVYPLDPSYEDTEEPRNETNEAIFKQLQKCSHVKLVEPVGEEHMYWAAMNRTGCRLTPLGRRYHRLASQARL